MFDTNYEINDVKEGYERYKSNAKDLTKSDIEIILHYHLLYCDTNGIGNGIYRFSYSSDFYNKPKIFPKTGDIFKEIRTGVGNLQDFCQRGWAINGAWFKDDKRNKSNIEMRLTKQPKKQGTYFMGVPMENITIGIQQKNCR